MSNLRCNYIQHRLNTTNDRHQEYAAYDIPALQRFGQQQNQHGISTGHYSGSWHLKRKNVVSFQRSSVVLIKPFFSP